MSLTTGELRGITEAVLNALKAQGLGDTNALLEVAKTPQGRNSLAVAVGIDAAKVLELANRADLARIKGIGRVYSDLLEEAGVNTINELAGHSPESLHTTLIKINKIRQYTQRPPSIEQIADFVEQAKALPKLVE